MTKCTCKFRLLETLARFSVMEFNYSTMWDPTMNDGRGGVFFLVLNGDHYIRFDEEEEV
jgi:hypothetical protein